MTRARDLADQADGIIVGDLNVDGGTIKLDGNYPVGANNVALGDAALDSNVSGASNVAIGADALTANTAGNNTAVGYQAGYSNTTGYNNLFAGVSAGDSNTTGALNALSGSFSGATNTTGSYNTAYGAESLYSNTTASNNTAVGYQAGYSNTTGIDNTFLGMNALRTNTTGSQNTAVGKNALYTGTGTYNTAVGFNAGSDITTGSKNTILGAYGGNQGGLDIRTSSNNIVLSDGDGNPRVHVNSSGFLHASGGTTDFFGPANHVFATTTDQGNQIAQFLTSGHSGQNSVIIYTASSEAGANVAATILKVSKNSSTSRSINTSGTINASGADYAEYMTKASDFTLSKGDISGINADGKLTNVFANSVSFVVKSTNPSYVGGDTWGTEEVLGKQPSENATDEEKDAYNSALETAREKVDRIAFCGQVPVNVTGASVGDFIIPVQNGTGIAGQAVSSPTLEQYMSAVGKVIAIEDDGRAKIIVKVA